MILTESDYRLLAFLHDAKCLEIIWDYTNSETKSIRVVVIGDSDCGYAAWEGKTLTITISDVVVSRFTSRGYALGDEIIDSWTQTVSDSFRRDCDFLLSTGISVPDLRFSITFQSGSVLEAACGLISIEQKFCLT